MDNRLISKYNHYYRSDLRGYKLLSIRNKTDPYLTKDNIPNSLNWTSKGSVTSVKSQLMCGSDWAFAAVAYAESKLIIDGI